MGAWHVWRPRWECTCAMNEFHHTLWRELLTVLSTWQQVKAIVREKKP